MTSGSILLWGMLGVALVVVAFFVFRWWRSNVANDQYVRGKAAADKDVHRALQGRSFIVGTPSDFIDGDLHGHFTWLSGERAWGLRLQYPNASLRSLAGLAFPLWVSSGDGEGWVRHPGGDVRLKAYNADVSFVLPQGLKDGEQIRLGVDAADHVAA
jgi:hypothetical protein